MFISKQYTFTQESFEPIKYELYARIRLINRVIIFLAIMFGLTFIWRIISLGFVGLIFLFMSLIFAIPALLGLFLGYLPLSQKAKNNFLQKVQTAIDLQTVCSFEVSPNRISLGVGNNLKHLDFTNLKLTQTKNFLIFNQILYRRTGMNSISTVCYLGTNFAETLWIVPKNALNKQELEFIYSKCNMNLVGF